MTCRKSSTNHSLSPTPRQTFPIYPRDFPADSAQERSAKGKAIASSALSAAQASDARDVSTYRLLGSLGSHDLSAMRELLGSPNSCIAATRSKADGPPFITALLEYDGFTTTYETGIDNIADFDAHIEVIGDGKRLKLRYDTVSRNMGLSSIMTRRLTTRSSATVSAAASQPYVKGLPISLEIKERDEHGHYVERTIRPTYEDAYTLEWKSFYASVMEGTPVKTTPKDAAQDLDIFDMIMKKLVN